MSPRKAWSDLSSSYRARLERKGVTAAVHAQGGSRLRAARGHGAYTPSARRDALEHKQRRTRRMTGRDVMATEQRLGLMKVEQVAEMLERIGPSRASMVLEWQQYRKDIYNDAGDRKGLGDTMVSLPEFVESRYGDEAWDEFMDEWWDDVSDDAWIGYYH